MGGLLAFAWRVEGDHFENPRKGTGVFEPWLQEIWAQEEKEENQRQLLHHFEGRLPRRDRWDDQQDSNGPSPPPWVPLPLPPPEHAGPLGLRVTKGLGSRGYDKVRSP